MTEQEMQAIIDELEKRMRDKKETDGTQTVLKEPRDKWFRDKNGSVYNSAMGAAFDAPGATWQVWEAIRRLTCLIYGEQYVRRLVGKDGAAETAEKLCQFVYDLRSEVKGNG